jgi:1-acyl-sn-glycerol-3-phosphate acyltransferase
VGKAFAAQSVGNRAWRVVATGLCFASFGLGGVVLSALVFPVLRLLLRNQTRLVRVSRAIIHHAFRFFVWEMKTVGVLSYEVHGRERLQRPGLLVVANHPTLIDVIFLISLIPQASCVVKSSLAKNPATSGPVRSAGYVINDQGVALIDDALDALKHGDTLVIFPEGTRTPREGTLSLQRGAANVAVRVPRALTPVIIRCEPLTLGKGEKWYNVPSRRVHFTIEVREDVAVDNFLAGATSAPLAARALTAWLETYFEEARHGGA